MIFLKERIIKTMSKLDIKRVKEYMEELGYERDEAIALVKAEEEEAKKTDFEEQTNTTQTETTPGITKEDVLQIIAEQKEKEKGIDNVEKETMSDALKKILS
jgi:hypothetical protein